MIRLVGGTGRPTTRTALLVSFASTGLALATFIGRTPAIREALGASIGHMGQIILGLSIGSGLGVLAGGRLVARRGARAGILAGLRLLASGLMLVGLGCYVHSAPTVVLGLVSCGTGLGFGEVAFNVEAAALETALGRSVLPSVHAAFSAGTLVGSCAAALAVTGHVSVMVNMGAVAMIVLGAGTVARVYVPSGTGRELIRQPHALGPPRPHRIWKEKRTVSIGLTLLGGAFAEGTANDWIPLATQQGHHASPATASAIYVVFALTATITRTVGGRVVDRVGRAPVLRGMYLLAATGITVFIVSSGFLAVMAGAALWG